MNTKARIKEENLPNDELRDHLCAQIEIEWNSSRNADLVDELAFQHPELASELYEFFAVLIQTEIENEDENGNGGIEEDSDKRLAEWLQNEGFAIALKAGANACHNDSTSPTDAKLTVQAKVRTNAAGYIPNDSAPTGKLITYDKFLRAAQKRENMQAKQIAAEINTPLPLIFIAEENFDPQFDPLRDELSGRYARRFGRNEQQARASFRPVAMVASTGKTIMTRHTVENIVKNLPKAERDFWLTLMGFNK